jgi:SNF2 family DNA or RNA helicase
LNIQHASIVIIAEPQWNRNTEAQAISRAYRQGQSKVVKALILHGRNSAIDNLVLHIQKRKTSINTDLMGPLIRKPEEGPAHIPLLSFPEFLPVDYD